MSEAETEHQWQGRTRERMGGHTIAVFLDRTRLISLLELEPVHEFFCLRKVFLKFLLFVNCPTKHKKPKMSRWILGRAAHRPQPNSTYKTLNQPILSSTAIESFRFQIPASLNPQMALNGSQLTLTALLVSSLVAVAAAQSSSFCSSALLSLSPCLNFIQGSATSPSSSCCSQLSSVVKSEPQCLCSVLDGSAAAGLNISINKTQALALPSACKVQTPPLSQCSTSSSSSPPSSGSTPSTPSSPSGGGANNVPSVDTGSANGSTAKISVPLVLSLLLMAVFSAASSVTA